MPTYPIVAAALAVSLLAGCDKAEDAAVEPVDETTADKPVADDEAEPAADPPAAAEDGLTLQSEAFEPGASLPARFTCDGDGVSPPLRWSGAPEGTKSFVVVVRDPDAPEGTFDHWGVYSIPASRTSLDAAIGDQPTLDFGAGQAENDFGKVGYGAPCPPEGDEAHTYRFRVLALDVVGLGFDKTPSVEALLDDTRNHVLADAELTATYARPAK